MRIIIITIILALFSLSVLYGQVTFQPRKLSNENRGIIYNTEFSTDFRLQTNGWSVGANWGTLKTYYLTRFYYFDLGERKHLKELRSNPRMQQDSYIYGKQNNLFILRGGIGEKRILSEKASKKGVAMGVSYRLGPSLGLLKPYYLEVSVNEQTSSATRFIRYSPETESLFLDDPSRIVGKGGIFKGWGEVAPAIGGHAMGSVHFAWGAFDQYVRAVEAGVMVDFFFQDIPILVETANAENFLNKPFFVNIFLNFQFGKRK